MRVFPYPPYSPPHRRQPDNRIVPSSPCSRKRIFVPLFTSESSSQEWKSLSCLDNTGSSFVITVEGEAKAPSLTFLSPIIPSLPFIDEEPYYSCLTESVTNIPGKYVSYLGITKTVFCGVLMDGKEFLLIPAENKSDADRTLKSGLEQITTSFPLAE